MGEVKELEIKEHRLGELMLMCEDVAELDRFATTFNHLYKTIRDHKVRCEEIEHGVKELVG